MHHVANTGVFNHLLEISDEWFETRLFTTRYCSVEFYQQGQEDIICYVKAFHSIVNQQLTSLGEKDKELHMAHLQKSGNCRTVVRRFSGADAFRGLPAGQPV